RRGLLLRTAAGRPRFPGEPWPARAGVVAIAAWLVRHGRDGAGRRQATARTYGYLYVSDSATAATALLHDDRGQYEDDRHQCQPAPDTARTWGVGERQPAARASWYADGGRNQIQHVHG